MSVSSDRCLEDWMSFFRALQRDNIPAPREIILDDDHFNLLLEATSRMIVDRRGIDSNYQVVFITIDAGRDRVTFRRAP